MIDSPCIGKCDYFEVEYCRGCYRTLSEIKTWSNLNDAAKQCVLNNVAKRKEEYSTNN